MQFSLGQSLAGLVVGVAIGLTGVGGGALLTPVTVLLFGVPAAVAVSSDLVVSLVTKPVGSIVHLRRGSPRLDVVRWLTAGSVPAAFAGAYLLSLLGRHAATALKPLLGASLVIAAGAMVAKTALVRRRGAPAAPITTASAITASPVAASAAPAPSPSVDPTIVGPRTFRPGATLAVGAAGGLLVGLTSVGSGSLMLVALALLYPDLSTRELVGTDLCQAVPLVAAATLGHVLFGHIDVSLATSILIGALPGVYLGARFSTRAPDRVVRPVLMVLLVASGLKLLGI